MGKTSWTYIEISSSSYKQYDSYIDIERNRQNQRDTDKNQRDIDKNRQTQIQTKISRQT